MKDDDSPISPLYEQQTGHLTPEQCVFFKEWEALISLEEQDLIRFRQELWTLTATEREKNGRCFANMVINEEKREEGMKVLSIHRQTYKFIRAPRTASYLPSVSDGSLLNGYISPGDAVTICVEPDLLALARGYVLEMQPHHITVGLDHDLSEESIRNRTRGSQLVSQGPRLIFRIDKDELSGGIGRIRDNLARMFYPDGDTKRLSLVVDLSPPKFGNPGTLTGDLPKELNVCQRDAIKKVLQAEDYALILGMPGTGKTTTIAEIIKYLAKQGKSVLLTSYTHSAVDTILAKLLDADFDILRLGNIDKVMHKCRVEEHELTNSS